MSRLLLLQFLFVLPAACIPPLALANDGGLVLGGSPRLLDEHPTVSMQSELIHMTVGEEDVKVDCQFVFHNAGPARVVAMGFPDRGLGADNPDEEDENWKQHPPKALLTNFHSYVNGKEVKTKLERGKNSGEGWHVKVVRFPANATLRVRDTYVSMIGGQVAATNYAYKQTSYILHTGSSWHGNIGRSEVVVTFKGKRPTTPIQLRSIRAIGQDHVAMQNWPKLPNTTLYYQGPGKPVIQGRTLRFVRTNWRPTNADDIWFCYR